MEVISCSEKLEKVRIYYKYLKKQLKKYSGESVKRGGIIETKLKLYEKLKKLINKCNNDQNIKINEDNIDRYYKYLQKKIEKLTNDTTVKTDKQPIENIKIVDSPNKSDGTFVDDNIQEGNEAKDDEESEIEIDEIGPTPQLNGRVLTIFDIETSPKNFNISPIKHNNDGLLSLNQKMGITNSKDGDEIFKTPTSKRILTSNPGKIELSYLNSSSKKLSFDEVGFTTPKHDRIKVVLETPNYLRSESITIKTVDKIIISDQWSDDDDENDYNYNSDEDSTHDTSIEDSKNDEDLNYEDVENLPDIDESAFEPSPIIKKCGRSVYDLHNDLISLKKNLSGLKEFMDEENADNSVEYNGLSNDQKKPITDNLEANEQEQHLNTKHDLDEIDNVFDPHMKLRKKMKTIKRSTRRAKLRTDNLDYKDEMEHLDIHALAFSNVNKNESKHRILFDNIDDDEINFIELEDDNYKSDEEYVRKDFATLEKELNINKNSKSKSKGKHPLSNNFVKLKINNKHRGKFRKR